jgi:hypothetical protein
MRPAGGKDGCGRQAPRWVNFIQSGRLTGKNYAENPNQTPGSALENVFFYIYLDMLKGIDTFRHGHC